MTTREKVLRNLGVPPHLARQASEGTRHERLEALKEAGAPSHVGEVRQHPAAVAELLRHHADFVQKR